MSVHQLKDGRWICKIPDPTRPGGSRREYFGRGAAAESKARSRDRSLDLNRTRPAAQDSGPLFSELVTAYLDARKFSPGSHYRIRSLMSSVILPSIGNIPAARLTHADIDRHVNARLQSVKSDTARRDITMIQAVMNFAVRRRPQMIPFNPLAGYPLPRSDAAVFIPPTIVEITEILKHAHERLRRFILIAFYCGLRPGNSELLSLKWESVLWSQNVIRVTSAAKGGIQMREVPINPGFLVELRKWHEADNGEEYIVNYHGHKITRLQDGWNKAKKAAGITRRMPLYSLRHFFVTSAIEAGADYKTLSEIVGSNPETLRRHYQHVSSAARVKLIENMPVLAGNF